MADNTTYRDIANNDTKYVPYIEHFKPWEHSFTGKKTCTAYIWDIQQELLYNKEQPIDRHQIAKALSNKNILQQTKTIEISTILKFASIEFDIITTMETFCLEPLTIPDACQITFRLDFIKRNKPNKRYTIISFFNVPTESDIQLLNDFLDQFADIEGQARHQIKKCNDIEYKTGTVTYKVTNMITDIHRYNNLFGRSTKCIYKNQPIQKQRRAHPRNFDEETEKNEEQERDTQILNQQKQQPNNQHTTEAQPNNRQQAKTTDTEKNKQTNKQQYTTNTNKKSTTIHNQTKSTNTTTQNSRQNTGKTSNPKNITTRKKQNHMNNQEYKIDLNPPDFNMKIILPYKKKPNQQKQHTNQKPILTISQSYQKH